MHFLHEVCFPHDGVRAAGKGARFPSPLLNRMDSQ
jgi:hypothetical protein